jgi:hypothetical protein
VWSYISTLLHNLIVRCVIKCRDDFTFSNTLPKLKLWYSDWLWAGRLRGQSPTLGMVKNFHFIIASRPALGSTQPPIQLVSEDNSPPASAEVKKM